MEDNLQWKRTSNGRRPPMEDDLQWNTTSDGGLPPMEDDLQWKTISNGRQPQMEDDLQWKTTSNIKSKTSLTSIMSKPFLLGNDKYFISAAVIRHWLDLIDILRVMLLNPYLSPVCTKMFTHKIHYAEHILKNTQP
jgi:hypothetical protein